MPVPRSLAEIGGGGCHVGPNGPTWSPTGSVLSQWQSACGTRSNGRVVFLQTGLFQPPQQDQPPGSVRLLL